MFLWRKKSKKEQSVELRHKRLQEQPVQRPNYCRAIIYGICFFILLAVVGFGGQSFSGPQLFLNNIAKTRIVAESDFDYESEIKTNSLREQRRQMVSPVYKVDLGPFRRFSQKIEILKTQLMECDKIINKDEQKKALEQVIELFESKYSLSLQIEDLEALLRIATSTQRNRCLEEGLFVLQETIQKGIFDETDMNSQLSDNFSVNVAQKDSSLIRLQSKGNALRALRMNLFVMDIEYDIANALIHILKFGLTPNLTYDKKRTEEKIRQFVEKTPNVIVHVNKGDPIVEEGKLVTAEIYECFVAYQKIMEQTDIYRFTKHNLIAKRIVLAFLFFVCTLSFVLLLPTKLRTSSRFLWIFGTIILLNIVLIKLVYLAAYYLPWGNKVIWIALIPFLAPVFFSALVITPLIDAIAGMGATCFVMGFSTLMLHGNLDYFLLNLIAGVFAVYLCRKIHLRASIAKAGLYSSSLLAVIVFFYSLLIQSLGIELCLQQLCAIVASGLLTTLLAIVILPVFEKICGYTTDITFLELTDYNHPLLRKLQVLAPGTYHHSLMVATLAEKVATEIGANALLCRCCALYHDIGKLLKPEYFTENQKDGVNPHEKQTPSMSAVILKSHVKEGIELGKSYHLPKIILDVIQQHHGTSIMQYFYRKALRNAEVTGEEVDASVFRYDGPKPQFKESAIISLADAVEAASRSLTKISAQSVHDLIDEIVRERIETEQFTECSVTLKEIDCIKKSFQATLLNMMHSRISYAEDDAAENKTDKPADTKGK